MSQHCQHLNGSQRSAKALIPGMCKHALRTPAGSQCVTITVPVAGITPHLEETQSSLVSRRAIYLVLGFSFPKGSTPTATTLALRLAGLFAKERRQLYGKFYYNLGGSVLTLNRDIEMLDLDGTLFTQNRTVTRSSNWPSNIEGSLAGPPRPCVIAIQRKDSHHRFI